MNLKPDFHPSQIVCLDDRTACLYAEIIQIVWERQVVWVRPLALIEAKKGADLPSSTISLDPDQLTVYDLRQGADLLCPLSLFRTGLDTEVIPVLMALDSPKTELHPALSPEPRQHQHGQLKTFLHRIWQAHPSIFQV